MGARHPGNRPLIVEDKSGNAFIREVDDEFRRDKLGRAWGRYGRWLFVGIGALLIGAAGLLYWRKWQGDQADVRATRYSDALAQVRAGQGGKAAATFADLAHAPQAGYRALAVLQQAGMAVTTDPAKAAGMYRAAAANGELAQPFRDLALLKATEIEFDRLPPANVVETLRPLAQQGNPWFGTAGELTALAYLREGKADLARPILAAIVKDESVPASIRGRASQLQSAVAPADSVAPPAAAAGAPSR